MVKNKGKVVAMHNMHSYFGKRELDADLVDDSVDDLVAGPNLNKQ
jgi:hypothetical protein